MLISGDIGGTKTWLQLTDFKNGQLNIIAAKQYVSSDFDSAAAMTQQFLHDIGHKNAAISVVCYAIAGPIIDDRVQLTNLPWDVDQERLSKLLDVEHVFLINDFEAICFGLDSLPSNQLYTLQEGNPRPLGSRAIIGAGTGLGIAMMHANSQGTYAVSSTEGGHVDFAPTSDRQLKLLKYLRRKYHRVSSERVLSGQGLVNIYKFIRENPLYNETENSKLQLAMHREDPAAMISHYAIVEKDPMARRAVGLFIDIYGAQAGNLALMSLPYGGIYIVGGIAPKILDQLTDGRFMKAFLDKGRMSRLLQSFPVHIVLDAQVGLKGAAVYAINQLQ